MEIRSITSERAPKPVGPYSQAIVAQDLVFCAGQLPIDPATGDMILGEIGGQTRRVLENLSAVLAAAGSDLRHVVKTTVFLTDMAEFPAMNEAYATAFGDHRPARSTVEVGKLARGARVEIECIAVRA